MLLLLALALAPVGASVPAAGSDGDRCACRACACQHCGCAVDGPASDSQPVSTAALPAPPETHPLALLPAARAAVTLREEAPSTADASRPALPASAVPLFRRDCALLI